MKYNNFYYLQFNGQLYFLQYKGESSALGHCFKSVNDNDTVYVGETKLFTENPVLWKVK
jgi:hypothetical protein